jgi:hypothetical protein
MPFLVDADYVAYLDEDNEFDPDHLRDLVRAAVTAKVSWAHSLRRIVDASGADVCPDNCESLGGICHTACGRGDYLIDTSCYLIARDLAIEASPLWNHRFRSGVESDRELAKALLAGRPHAVVRRHSVRYRVGNTANSVTADFFTDQNARLGYDFAKYEDVYVFHFSPKATADFLSGRRDATRSRALDEWQMTLWSGLDGGGLVDTDTAKYNLLDGYANAPNIPHGATVLVSVCLPHDVPWDFLQARADLHRVAYMLESPNARHADQYDPVALAKTFDVVLTYWKPLLVDPRVRTLPCHHNTHNLHLDNPLDAAQLRTNSGTGKSCAMVLECRGNRGSYQVPNMPGVQLQCQDYMRELLVKDLRDCMVFGAGWDAAAARNPGVKLGHALHRSRDPRHAVDILSGFTFAVVVENCDAEGYVSEKIFDCLIAGAIGIYMGPKSGVPAHLGIPEGVTTGVYIDLRARLAGVPEHRWSAEVQTLVDGLTDDQVAAMKARVVAHREAILDRVGVKAFARVAQTAIDLKPQRP